VQMQVRPASGDIEASSSAGNRQLLTGDGVPSKNQTQEVPHSAPKEDPASSEPSALRMAAEQVFLHKRLGLVSAVYCILTLCLTGCEAERNRTSGWLCLNYRNLRRSLTFAATRGLLKPRSWSCHSVTFKYWATQALSVESAVRSLNR